MKAPFIRGWRIALAAGVLAGGLALWRTHLPARSEPAPAPLTTPTLDTNPAAVKVACPATAQLGRKTRATLEFTLPTGARLTGTPRVRVTDLQCKVWELLPVYLDKPAPQGQGHRDLNTPAYAPGAYQVTGEVEYQTRDGQTVTSVSTAAPLVTPAG